MNLPFAKMHGLGNDFVVIDATRAPARELLRAPSPALLRRLTDRRFGVGCDQVLLVEPPPSPDVDFGYRIFNADGNPLIPESAHARLAAPASNDGMQVLRRGYSYDNGLSFTAERWPPWRQGMEFDAGLLFLCYQRDPRTGFVSIFDKMSKFDMMNQFVTHVGGGLFACPGGAAEGGYVGQALFETA